MTSPISDHPLEELRRRCSWLLNNAGTAVIEKGVTARWRHVFLEDEGVTISVSNARFDDQIIINLSGRNTRFTINEGDSENLWGKEWTDLMRYANSVLSKKMVLDDLAST